VTGKLSVMQCRYQVGSLGHSIGFMGNQNMGVTPLGGSYIGVAQKSLDGPYIFCGHEGIGCKGVAKCLNLLVGARGFEPPASCSQSFKATM